MLDDLLGRTTIENSHQLFVANLGSCLTMENTVETMLGKLIEEAQDSELKQQLRTHLEQTQAQIRNIHSAFEALGEEPNTNPCAAIEGIEKDGEMKLKMVPDELNDLVILAGCAETEHHEIAVYENLIVHADAMGHEDVIPLLRENLEQEQFTLGEVLKATIKQEKQRSSAAA